MINEYREKSFPVQNPEIEEVSHDDLEKRDMISQ
jgi:hypothetical protein